MAHNTATNDIRELQIRRENNRLFCPHDGCGYNGSVYWRIRDHILSWHLDTAPWPCPAPGCNEGLNTKPALEVHARAVHSGDDLETVLRLMSDIRTVAQRPDRSIVVQYGTHVAPHVPVTIPGMPSTNGAQNPNHRTTVWAPAAPGPAPSADATPFNQLPNGDNMTSTDGDHPASSIESTPFSADSTPFTIFTDGDHPAPSADSTPFTIFTDGDDPAPSVLANGTYPENTASGSMSPQISDGENQDYLDPQLAGPRTSGHVEEHEYLDDQSASTMTNGHMLNGDAAWYYNEGQYTTAPSTSGGLEPIRHVLASITQTPDALSSSAHGYQFVFPAFASTNLNSDFTPRPIAHARPLTNGAYYDDPGQMSVHNMDRHQYNDVAMSNGTHYEDASQMPVQTMDHHQYNNVAQYQQQVPIPGQHPSYQQAQLLQMQNAVFEHLEQTPLDQFQPFQDSRFDNPSPFDDYRQLTLEEHLQAHREREQEEVRTFEQNWRTFLDENMPPTNEEDDESNH